MNYIEAINVRKEFGEGDAKVAAVSSIDLSIRQGEFISIMGEVRTWNCSSTCSQCIDFA
jgi:ABC-type dipeptide/oligopeptide/nickel transport system ATPase subunit